MRIYTLFPDKWSWYPQTFYKHDKEKFQELNDQWYGVFVSVNEFDADLGTLDKWWTYRQEQFLSRLTNVYCDIDFSKTWKNIEQSVIDKKKMIMIEYLQEYCEPNVIVFTKNGLHVYWKIDVPSPTKKQIEQYKAVNKWIIQWTEEKGSAGDAVFDTQRVLRLPWYYHMKEEPYLVQHEVYHDTTYTLEWLAELFPYDEPVEESYIEQDKSVMSLQMREIDKIDIKDIVIRACNQRWQKASFDSTGRLVIEWYWVTGNFQGKQWDRQYMASTSHDPIEWNKTTVVGKMLNMSYGDAYKWIIEEFDIPSEHELKKQAEKPINKKSNKEAPKKFSELGYNIYSTGNKVIDSEIGHFWDNELVVLHWPSKNGKTMFTMSMANINGLMWTKVAFFSLEMDRKKLKTQQAAIRSGIDRVSFEQWNYDDDAWEEYKRYYIGFDDNFTIFDENDLWKEEGMTLDNIIINIEKLYEEKDYRFFIIDSLTLIGGQNTRTNQRQEVIMKRLRKLKNSIPICIVLIHHNRKWWDSFSGNQAIENFSDWRIEVKKKVDPSANGTTIFNQTKITVWKERLGKEIAFLFDFVNGKLRFDDKMQPWLKDQREVWNDIF